MKGEAKRHIGKQNKNISQGRKRKRERKEKQRERKREKGEPMPAEGQYTVTFHFFCSEWPYGSKSPTSEWRWPSEACLEKCDSDPTGIHYWRLYRMVISVFIYLKRKCEEDIALVFCGPKRWALTNTEVAGKAFAKVKQPELLTMGGSLL